MSRFFDGCCGGGGAARGLAQDGRHEVTGVDINPRLRDTYLRSGAAEFICADILEVLGDISFMARFDAAHASMRACDRRAMRPARLMGATYAALLDRLEARGWHDLHQRVRVPTWRKLWIAARHAL